MQTPSSTASCGPATAPSPRSIPTGSTYTNPTAINPEGAITGQYCDAITCHGFLRARDGTFTTIDPPGTNYSEADAINPAGAIAGLYQPGIHGFLRARDGTFTIFDVPGSQYTWRVAGINRGIVLDA
jgi:hypothetical protein